MNKEKEKRRKGIEERQMERETNVKDKKGRERKEYEGEEK